MSVFSPVSSEADIAPRLTRCVGESGDASAYRWMALLVPEARVPLAVPPLLVPSIRAPPLHQQVEGQGTSTAGWACSDIQLP